VKVGILHWSQQRLACQDPNLHSRFYAAQSGVLSSLDRGRISYTELVKLASIVAVCLLIPGAQTQKFKMIQIDESFNGRDVTMQVGQILEISLAENASTGYQWSIPAELKSKLASFLREREGTLQVPDAQRGRPTLRHLHYEALAAGTVTLEIYYQRSWENHKSPARKFTLRVLIRPATHP
jgi:inhibitor of cysteine peptidase